MKKKQHKQLPKGMKLNNKQESDGTQSYYHGDGHNKALTTYSEVYEALKKQNMEVDNMKKLFYLILFVFFAFYGYSQTSSINYNEFIVEMKDFESAEQSPQVERYKYETTESIMSSMIKDNDMVGLKLLSKHYMWDAIRTIGFGGILQIAVDHKNLEAFCFILNDQNYKNYVITDSYGYEQLINTNQDIQLKMQTDTDKIYVEMKKLLDNFVSKYPMVKNIN